MHGQIAGHCSFRQAAGGLPASWPALFSRGTFVREVHFATFRDVWLGMICTRSIKETSMLLPKQRSAGGVSMQQLWFRVFSASADTLQ